MKYAPTGYGEKIARNWNVLLELVEVVRLRIGIAHMGKEFLQTYTYKGVSCLMFELRSTIAAQCIFPWF